MDKSTHVISRNDFPVAVFFGAKADADKKALEMQAEHFRLHGGTFDSKEDHDQRVRYHTSNVPVVS